MTALDTIKQAVFGVPFDPGKQPSRQGVVKAFSEMQTQLEAAQAGAFVRSTRTTLNAFTAAPASAMAWVVNDPTQANNGIYENTGATNAAVWTRRADIPQFVVTALNTGEGTGNAIEASTDRPIPVQDGRCLILVSIAEANTGQVRISFNGGSYKNLISSDGSEIRPASLQPGMIVAGYITGSDSRFQLISQLMSEAILDAISEAEGWATTAENFANLASTYLLQVQQQVNNVTPDVIRFSGNGSNVEFNLGTGPINENLTNVYVGGVYQQKNTYSIDGSGKLIFSVAPASGTNNIEVVISGSTAMFVVANFADQPTAEAGTDVIMSMNSLRVKQSIVSHSKRYNVGRSPELFGGTSVASIMAALASGGPVDLFPTTYVTTTLDNLDIDKIGIVPAGTVFQSVMSGDSLTRDRNGNLIGYSMNHRQELMWTGSYPRNVPGTQITTGNAKTSHKKAITSASHPVDIAAHWYLYWGTDWFRQAIGIASETFDQWYDWHWNWTSNPDYDPARHPIQGWYRGDDPNILDQQCCWLIEAGVKVVIPVAFDLNISTWHLSTDMHYPMYQLFNNSPNFRQLSYIPWVQSSAWANQPSSPTPTEIATQWDQILFGLSYVYENNYVMNFRGKRWFTVYCWDSEFLRSQVFDTGGGSINYAAFLKTRADAAIAAGYDGIAVLFHNPTENWIMNRDALFDNNVLYLYAPYGGPWASDPASADFEEVVNTFNPPSTGVVVNVSTSLKSKGAITEFDFDGSTPSLARNYVARALRHVVNHKQDLPQLVTIYNVSEWAEGGPGLIPNKQWGFAYLDIINEAMCSISGQTLDRSDLIPLTLANSWVNYGANEEPARCYKDATGTVFVSGLIKDGTTTGGTLITTLPVGYRPAKTQGFSVGLSGSSGSVLISPNGQITADSAMNASRTSLSGICFKAA